jgi:hypothetical protein
MERLNFAGAAWNRFEMLALAFQLDNLGVNRFGPPRPVNDFMSGYRRPWRRAIA